MNPMLELLRGEGVGHHAWAKRQVLCERARKAGVEGVMGLSQGEGGCWIVAVKWCDGPSVGEVHEALAQEWEGKPVVVMAIRGISWQRAAQVSLAWNHGLIPGRGEGTMAVVLAVQRWWKDTSVRDGSVWHRGVRIELPEYEWAQAVAAVARGRGGESMQARVGACVEVCGGDQAAVSELARGLWGATRESEGETL